MDRTGPNFFCRMAGPVVLVLVSHDMREDVSGDGDELDRAHTQHGERLPSSVSIWHAFVSHAERGKKVLGGRCVCVSCAVWWEQCSGRELHGEPHCDLGEGRTDWKSSLVG